MKTAVIYARFSCNKQREASIEDQLRVCNAWCDKEGYRVVGQYCDYAISGRTDERPEFLRMIANAGESDIVLVYMMDRFSRDEYDAPIYKKRLRDAGVRVVSATESIPDGPEAVLIEKLYEGLAAVESAHISARTQRGMHGNALKCKHNGVKVFGYDFTADGGYAVNDEQARLVREAFARRLSGESVNSIAVDFARRGVRSYTGKPCGSTLVQNMLRNEKYTGVYKFGDVRIPGGMPEIVDKETFSAVQRVRARKSRHEEEWGSFPLSGRAICAGCGRNLMGVSGRGRHHVKYEYYRCKGKDCNVKPVRADWLDGAIAEALRAIIDDPIRVADIARAVESEMQLGSGSESLQKAARKRVSDGKSGIEKLVDAISKGLDPALATDKIAELQAQVDAAERELSLIAKTEGFDTDEFIEYLQHGATLDDKTLLDALVYQVIVGERDVLVVLNFDVINAEPATIDLQRVRANCVWLPIDLKRRIGVVSEGPRMILLVFPRAA